MVVRRRLTVGALMGYTGFRWLLLALLGVTLAEMAVLMIVLPIPFAIVSPHLYDFSYYYDAALALRLNPHANIYDPNLVSALAHARHLFYPGGVLGYPLLLPILVIPLTLFSFHIAALIWFIFNLLLWLLNIALLINWLQSGLRGGAASTSAAGDPLAVAWREASRGGGSLPVRVRAAWRSLSDSGRFALIVGLFVGVSFAPIIAAQLLGQASMLMLTCFLLMFWLMRRGHSGAAGFLLTVVILIKLFPAVLLLYFLTLRRWRVLLGAAVGLVALLAGMTAVVGLNGVLSMRALFSVISSDSSTIANLNESLAHVPLWISYEVGVQPGAITSVLGDLLIAVVAVVFCAGLFVWDRRRRVTSAHLASSTSDADDYLGYGWALCTMFLVTPLSEEHYAIWLLPAILFCLGYVAWLLGQRLSAKEERSPRETLLLLGVILALALNFTALPFGYDGRLSSGLDPFILGHPLRPIFMVVRPLAALSIWLIAGILLLRPRDAAQAALSAAHTGAGAIPWQALRRGMFYLLVALFAWRFIIQIVQDVAVPTLR